MFEKTLQEIYQEEKGLTPYSHDGGFTYEFTIWVMRVAYCGATQAGLVECLSDSEGLKLLVAIANLREVTENL